MTGGLFLLGMTDTGAVFGHHKHRQFAKCWLVATLTCLTEGLGCHTSVLWECTTTMVNMHLVSLKTDQILKVYVMIAELASSIGIFPIPSGVRSHGDGMEVVSFYAFEPRSDVEFNILLVSMQALTFESKIMNTVGTRIWLSWRAYIKLANTSIVRVENGFLISKAYVQPFAVCFN